MMNTRRYFSRLLLVLAVGLSFACAEKNTALEEASRHYKQHRDYASLEVIAKRLSRGMSRQEVELLLGEADYSPTDGQYYYSSSRAVKSPDRQHEISITLVVDYRDKNGNLTDRLTEYSLEPVGE